MVLQAKKKIARQFSYFQGIFWSSGGGDVLCQALPESDGSDRDSEEHVLRSTQWTEVSQRSDEQVKILLLKMRNYNSSPYSRYNEEVNKQPFVVSHDLLKKIKPKTDEDKVDNYNN